MPPFNYWNGVPNHLKKYETEIRNRFYRFYNDGIYSSYEYASFLAPFEKRLAEEREEQKKKEQKKLDEKRNQQAEERYKRYNSTYTEEEKAEGLRRFIAYQNSLSPQERELQNKKENIVVSISSGLGCSVVLFLIFLFYSVLAFPATRTLNFYDNLFTALALGCLFTLIMSFIMQKVNK